MANAQENRGSKQVYIGCKLATGLIMELITTVPKEMGFSQPAPVAEKRVWLQGANQARVARSNPAEHKFGLTLVDEAFAEEWFRRNKDLKFVKEGAVFRVDSKDAYTSEIKDRTKDLSTGIEPIDPLSGKDSRMSVDPDKAHLAKLSAERQNQEAEEATRKRLGVA
jgi:hypothetical protein